MILVVAVAFEGCGEVADQTLEELKDIPSQLFATSETAEPGTAETAEPDYDHIYYRHNPVFSDGASEGTLEIENVPSNKYAQVVSITLDDSGKEIYNSGLIQPNYHIQTDKLSEALAAGTYDCTATFTAYDTSDSENPIEVGSAAAKITISVLS